MDRELFEQMYREAAPWDIGRPQPSVVKLAEAGLIRGSVLDVGCGTGDNGLFLASLGHETWGLDYVPAAIERAKAKASERSIAATFVVGDALKLPALARQFDTALDCGLFHTFSDDERPVFVHGLAAVLRGGGLLHVLCFSDAEPVNHGPRRVSEREIHDCFGGSDWSIERIEPARFAVTEQASPMFSVGGPRSWCATIRRK